MLFFVGGVAAGCGFAFLVASLIGLHQPDITLYALDSTPMYAHVRQCTPGVHGRRGVDAGRRQVVWLGTSELGTNLGMAP